MRWRKGVFGLAPAVFLGDLAIARDGPVVPRIMIVAMWEPEAQVWYARLPEAGLGDLTGYRIAVPGLSMLFPTVDCTADGDICLLTVGEGEINAAVSMTALAFSPLFDLRKTYFLFTGIAGVNPRKATLGSVALARYSVQVALQYEIDTRSLPEDWPSGYFAYGCDRPDEYPTIAYGTEVFELNAALRDRAYLLASNATLSDSDGPRQYRARYDSSTRPVHPKKFKRPLHKGDDVNISQYRPASGKPAVVRCDSATSDVYYSGTRLSEAFERTTNLWTNGTGDYCMTAQEDNANLEVMVRAAIDRRVDFTRIIVMRSGNYGPSEMSEIMRLMIMIGSNFDRPPPQLSDLEHLTRMDQNGFAIAIDNLFNAGLPIVCGILHKWDCTYKEGIRADNYVGDIFGSLGGEPDFGLGSLTGGERVKPSGGNEGSDGGDEHAKRMRLRRGLRRRGRHLLSKL